MTNKTNSFEVVGDTIYIRRSEWNQVALTTYREDYIEEIKTHVWTLKNGYPYNATLGGYLHRYIIRKWYGDNMLDEMTKKGYVVDHLNNNHMDCRISNLEFLKHNRNVAKGQYLDKESEEMRKNIALSIFKDFSTGLYQITIACNNDIVLVDCTGKIQLIDAIRLLYNCIYEEVILDAERILTQYDENNNVNLMNLHYCDIEIRETKAVGFTEEEAMKDFIEKEGVIYINTGKGNVIFYSEAYTKGWIPSLTKKTRR